MPSWARAILRTIGILNTLALLVGFSFLVDSVFHVATGRIRRTDDAPYFYQALFLMTAIELAFFVVFVTTAVGFIRSRLSAANPYSLAVLLYVVYFGASSMAWRVGRGIGGSIASASAGNATTPFIFLLLFPFLYPAISVIIVQLLRQRYNLQNVSVTN